MAIPTFPTLPGLSFPVKKIPRFKTIAHESVNGIVTSQSTQPRARYAFKLPFEFLRADNATLEIQTLMSFYQVCQGRNLPFHFIDPDDFLIVGQVIGIGDGVTTAFGFVRTMVSVVDPIQDVNTAGGAPSPVNVYLNGVLKTPNVDYSGLGTAQYNTTYGVQFVAAPGVGQVVTADFSWSWLCKFDEDELEFGKFTKLNGKGLWESKEVKFTSIFQ